VTATMIEDVLAGATVMVNAVCEPVPENVSTRKAIEMGLLPM